MGRLTSGVQFRHEKINRLTMAKSQTQTTKIQAALTELGIPQRLLMPTERVCREFERLVKEINILLDARKVNEKIATEIKILEEQRRIRLGLPKEEEQPGQQNGDVMEVDSSQIIDSKLDMVPDSSMAVTEEDKENDAAAEVDDSQEKQHDGEGGRDESTMALDMQDEDADADAEEDEDDYQGGEIDQSVADLDQDQEDEDAQEEEEEEDDDDDDRPQLGVDNDGEDEDEAEVAATPDLDSDAENEDQDEDEEGEAEAEAEEESEEDEEDQDEDQDEKADGEDDNHALNPAPEDSDNAGEDGAAHEDAVPLSAVTRAHKRSASVMSEAGRAGSNRSGMGRKKRR